MLLLYAGHWGWLVVNQFQMHISVKDQTRSYWTQLNVGETRAACLTAGTAAGESTIVHIEKMRGLFVLGLSDAYRTAGMELGSCPVICNTVK